MDFNRDRWGRPLVIPPDGGKAVPYDRFSSHGQRLEDRFNLEAWKLRTSAIGIAQRPDLYAQIAACPADDKKRLDALVKQTLEAGGSTIGAGLGTALHEFTQRVDDGTLDIDAVPDPWKRDILAYRNALDTYGLKIIPGLIECTLVNDELRLAGTADRFYLDTDDRVLLADIKTGKSIGDNPLGYVVQAACYANSVLYNIKTGERTPIDGLVTDVALIVHVPSGQARCDIYAIDAVAGYEAARTASEVKRWQRTKGLIAPLSSPTHGSRRDDTTDGSTVEQPPSAPVLPSVTHAIETIKEVFPGAIVLADERRVTWVRDRTKTVIGFSPAAAEKLARRWPDHIGTFKNTDYFSDEQLDEIIAVLDGIEAEHGIPFGAPDPTVTNTAGGVETIANARTAPAVVDEGSDADTAAVEALRQHLDTLTPDRLAWIGEMTVGANAAGLSISVKQRPSLRRLRIADALIAMSAFHDNDITHALLATVAPNSDVTNPGAVIGALTLDQATRLACITLALDDGALTLGFEDDGTPVIRGDLTAFLPKAA